MVDRWPHYYCQKVLTESKVVLFLGPPVKKTGNECFMIRMCGSFDGNIRRHLLKINTRLLWSNIAKGVLSFRHSVFLTVLLVNGWYSLQSWHPTNSVVWHINSLFGSIDFYASPFVFIWWFVFSYKRRIQRKATRWCQKALPHSYSREYMKALKKHCYTVKNFEVSTHAILYFNTLLWENSFDFAVGFLLFFCAPSGCENLLLGCLLHSEMKRALRNRPRPRYVWIAAPCTVARQLNQTHQCRSFKKYLRKAHSIQFDPHGH